MTPRAPAPLVSALTRVATRIGALLLPALAGLSCRADPVDLEPPASALPPEAGSAVAAPPAILSAVEELAALVPPSEARVIDAFPPTRPELPIVVVVRDVHINAGESLEAVGFKTLVYSDAARLALGAVAVQVLRVEEALLDGGVTVYAAEGLSEPLDRVYLDKLAKFIPELAALLGAPTETRRTTAEEMLARGSSLTAPLTLSAIHAERARVVGVEPLDVIARTMRNVDAVHRLDAATDAEADPFSVVRTRVLAGAATDGERAEYDRACVVARAVLDEYETFVLHERSHLMADGALALAAREGARAVGLVAGGDHARAIGLRLGEVGAGYLVVEPLGYAGAISDPGVWLASMRARFPQSARQR